MLRNAPHSTGSQTSQNPEVPKLPETGKTASSKRSCRLPGGRILEKTNTRRKENGSMRFINKKSAPNKERTKELLELKKQIMASQTAILSAQNQFEQVVDPDRLLHL